MFLFLDKLLSSDTRDWTHGSVGDSEVRKLETDAEYFDVRIESMRISKRRVGFAKFHAAAHSFFSYNHQQLGRVEMQSLTAPTKLQNLDKSALDRVLQLEEIVLGPVPYRGGSLNIEIGLFAVKSDDIGDSFLQFVTQVSKVGGVSFIQSAQPVLGLLKSGVDLLLGTEKASALKIGVAKEVAPPTVGTYAILAEEKEALDLNAFTLDPNDKRLLVDGKTYEKSDYLVYSVNDYSTRTDWAEIPDLRDGFNAVVDAIGEGEDEADTALNAFRLKCITTPDLLPNDGRRLYKKAKVYVDEAFPGGKVARREEIKQIKFADLALYA